MRVTRPPGDAGCSVSWVKLDDRLWSHPKVRRAWKRSRGSIGLYMLALTYSAQHETDGLLDSEWIEDMLPAKKEREQALDALVSAGLFDEESEGFRIHDYLDHNESREDAEARRERDRERKARGGRGGRSKDSGGTPDGFHAESAGNPSGLRVDSASTRAPVPSRPVPSLGETALSANADAGQETLAVLDVARSVPADVQAVFDGWIAATGKSPTRTKLDSKRRNRIKVALKSHGLEDCLAAVRGWKASPHHRGENPQGTVYNDLDLLLRDAAHIEKFATLGRTSTSSGGDFIDRLNRGSAA